jgi:hypothetical protein
MKRFEAGDTKYERYGDTVCCPYDPALTINGESLKFIVDAAIDPNSLQHDHFRNSDVGLASIFERRR